jgi:hypothetical protein
MATKINVARQPKCISFAKDEGSDEAPIISLMKGKRGKIIEGLAYCRSPTFNWI